MLKESIIILNNNISCLFLAKQSVLKVSLLLYLQLVSKSYDLSSPCYMFYYFNPSTCGAAGFNILKERKSCSGPRRSVQLIIVSLIQLTSVWFSFTAGQDTDIYTSLDAVFTSSPHPCQHHWSTKYIGKGISVSCIHCSLFCI